MVLKHLHRFIYIFFLWILISSDFSFAQENILSFYPKAYAKTQNPPEEKKLIIIAEQKIEDKFVTFIGVEKGKVLLAAITKDSLKDPKTEILLKIKFKNIEKEAQLLTVPYSDTVKITEWGYVFDRNKDGKIDYVAYLVAAIPVKPPQTFPSDFPKGEELKDHFLALINRYKENPMYFHMFWICLRLVFAHMADDDLDGNIDGVVIEAMDSERYWVDRWTALRSTRFELFAFRQRFLDSQSWKKRKTIWLGAVS